MGYINYSRSERSAMAIQGYEVPISMIDKGLIKSFIGNEFEEYVIENAGSELSLEEAKEFLLKLSVAEWKKAAAESGASSWHHTGCHYNRTNHYSMIEVSQYILENIEFFQKKKAVKGEEEKVFFIKIKGIRGWYIGTTKSSDNFYKVGNKKVRKNWVHEIKEANEDNKKEIEYYDGQAPKGEI